MSRTQWLLFTAWTFFIGCCLIAGIVTYLQVTWRLQASKANRDIRRMIAREEQALRASEEHRQASARHLLANDSVNEDSEFLRQLQRLISESGSKAEQIQSVPLALLPDIRNVRPPGTAESNRQSDEERNESPLNHLPLNIRARSTQVVLTGSMPRIQRFLHLITRNSVATLRINCNSMRLDRNGNGPDLRAILVVTRFIRPAPAPTDTTAPTP